MTTLLELPSALDRLLRGVPALSRAYLVGGCVRDALLGRPVKDFDIEVFGIGYEELAAVLARYGRADLVGRSFGVVKLGLEGAIYDFGIPRRDSKTGPGHKGFEIRLDPKITLPEAAARRDFTINALMYDPRERRVLDFVGGREDLDRRILRHTGPAFVEDPLRVLRGMQFAARFDLRPAPETVELCRSIVHTHPELALERVREEWFKWATRSAVPSVGLRFLDASGWIDHYPELAATRGVPQDPEWHPEGDVFAHTLHCVDALARLDAWRQSDPATRLALMFAVLTHDFGKVSTTHEVIRNGRPRITSPGHERTGVPLARSFLARIQAPNDLLDRVPPLVANHMARFEEATDRAVRRLARRLEPETVEHLCLVMTADASGRPPLPPGVPATVAALREAACRLRVAESAPRPVLRGRHLLALGMPPGPEVGRWTAAAFEAQLDGLFADLPGAHAWLAARDTLPPHLRDAARLRSDSPPPPIQ